MKRIIYGTAAIFISFLLFSGCSSTEYPALNTVENVDLKRYVGKWYEIARLPNSFQKNCYNATAEYSFIDASTIKVVNSCHEDSTGGELDRVTGKAYIVEGSNNSKLEVQFFWPFKGDYWIIALDTANYKYAMVGTPDRKYLWILSRTPSITKEVYHHLVDTAKKEGFDMKKVIVENYPMR